MRKSFLAVFSLMLCAALWGCVPPQEQESMRSPAYYQNASVVEAYMQHLLSYSSAEEESIARTADERAAKCAADNGGRDGHISTVPRRATIKANECIISAYMQTKYPYYSRYLDMTPMLGAFDVMRDLATQRQNGKISAQEFRDQGNEVIVSAAKELEAQTERLNQLTTQFIQEEQQQQVQQVRQQKDTRSGGLCNNGFYRLGIALMGASGNPNSQDWQTAQALASSCGEGYTPSQEQNQGPTSSGALAFLTRRENSNIPGKQQCVYNYMGHEVGLLYPTGSVCPVNVTM